MKFTQIPQDTFENLQLNAGVLLKSFDPSSPALVNDNIICATTGGITVNAIPATSDLGEDVDNCPKNTKELKQIDSWDCNIAFTSLGITADLLKMTLGSATKTSGTKHEKVAPNRHISQADFEESIWWVGDLANGGWVAAEIKNALSTGGFSLKTTDKGKGQLAVTITAHTSLASQDEVPMAFYIGEAEATA